MLARILSLLPTFNPFETPKQTNKDRLAAIHFPDNEIPESFCCLITEEIMDEPICLFKDTTEENSVSDKIVDKSSLVQYWESNNGTKKGFDPYTGLPLKEKPLLHVALKQKIDEFVQEKENLAERLSEIKIECSFEKAPYSNLSRLQSLNSSIDIPSNYVDPLNNQIMTYPIRLDDNFIIDLRTLIAFWNVPENKNINPFTFTFIKKMELDGLLQHEINLFLTCLESKKSLSNLKNLATQLAEVEEAVKKHAFGKTNEERLLEKNCDITTLPKDLRKKFIAHNFIEACITHPVRIDGYTVDYYELKNWWQQHPENIYQNFYTHFPIRSIQYDHTLKKEIERFVTDPELYVKQHRAYHYMNVGFLQFKKNALGLPARARIQKSEKNLKPY